MPFDDYASYDAIGLAGLVQKGEVSAEELAEEAIGRIEKHNGTLNAVINKAYDKGRSIAKDPGDGPLKGVPFLLKDLGGDWEGVPTQIGSRLAAGVPAPHNATLTDRFLAAGLVPLGKTSTPEFGLVPVTEPKLYGPCRNPWNTDHTPGGSSGGSAACVAAGIVPVAHANDGGGSIRIPAASCGLVGMKPTRARVPLGPDLGDVMSGLVCDHVVSRTVRDSALVLDCIEGPEPGDPYWAPPKERAYLDEVNRDPGTLRIAVMTQGMSADAIHPECRDAIKKTAKELESLGHKVEEAAPELDGDILTQSFMALWTSGLVMQCDGFAMLLGREVGPETVEGLSLGLYEQGKQVSGADYQMAVLMMQQAGRKVARFMQDYDVILSTTLGAPPLKIGAIDFDERDAEKAFGPVMGYVPFTPIQNATGQPAISLPLHWTQDGLPVGVHFAGRFGEEGLLYRLAGQLEQAMPWIDRKPPIWD